MGVHVGVHVGVHTCKCAHVSADVLDSALVRVCMCISVMHFFLIQIPSLIKSDEIGIG